MQKISSRRTFFYKKIFPVFWFGFIILFMAGMFFIPARPAPIPIPALIIPFIMLIFGYVLMRALVFDLMDEVYDDGTRLIVKNNAAEDSIALANIINVGHSIATNPPRIVLTLRNPCRFGTKVVFCPKTNWADIKSFGFTNSLADELIARVDAARRSA